LIVNPGMVVDRWFAAKPVAVPLRHSAAIHIGGLIALRPPA
jgi:hypothetical protein